MGLESDLCDALELSVQESGQSKALFQRIVKLLEAIDDSDVSMEDRLRNMQAVIDAIVVDEELQ